MNRWEQWVRDLRLRHARRPGQPALPAGVLARTAGATVRIRYAAARPDLHRHVHAYMALRLALPVSMAGRAPARDVLRHDPSRGAASRATAAGIAMRPPAVIAAVHSPATRRAAPSIAVPYRRLATGAVAGMPAGAARRSRPAMVTPALRAGIAVAAPVRQSRATLLRIRESARRDETRSSPPAAVLAQPRRPSREHPDDTAEPVRRGRPVPAGPDSATPAVDVAALAGMVIQQLDRRFVAYCERMGRV